MKKKHTLRLFLSLGAGVALSGLLSGCAGMWLGTDTDLNFTQPGGFGIDIGVGGPIGRPTPPPPPGGPGGPPPAGPVPPAGPPPFGW